MGIKERLEAVVQKRVKEPTPAQVQRYITVINSNDFQDLEPMYPPSEQDLRVKEIPIDKKKPTNVYFIR